MGRRPIARKAGTFVGVTLPPEMLRRVDSHARAIRAKGRTPSRTAAIRDLIERGLRDALRELEREFG
jgi:metal-responsive CopG/Arc/MetJ family transcriptional regulator